MIALSPATRNGRVWPFTLTVFRINTMLTHRQFPLTQQQHELWLSYLIDKSDRFNNFLSYELQGDLDHDCFRRALEFAYANMEASRSVIVDASEPIQHVLPPMDFSRLRFAYRDLRDSGDQCPRDAALAWIDQQNRQTLDITAAAGVIALARYGASAYVLTIVYHHIFMDAATARSCMAMIEQGYGRALAGAPVEVMRDSDMQRYLDACARVTDEAREDARQLWRSHLHGRGLSTDLGVRRRSGQMEEFDFAFPTELAAGVRQLCRTLRITPFIFMSGLFAAMVARLHSRDSVTVGYPVNVRPRGQPDLLGFYISRFPMALDIDSRTSFRHLLDVVRAHRKDISRLPVLDFTEIRDIALSGQTTESGPDLNLMIGETMIDAVLLRLSGVSATPLQTGIGRGQHDLGYFYDPSSPVLEGRFQFDNGAFSGAQMHAMAQCMTAFAECVVRDVDTALDALPYPLALPFSLLDATSAESPFRSLQQRFADVASAMPDAPAVVFGEQRLTYRDLLAHALQFAGELRGHGIGSGQLVAICVSRSPELIVAILGTLIAGAAYVPVDPQFPAERKQQMLADADPVAVITAGGAPYHDSGRRQIAVQLEASAPALAAPLPDLAARPDQLAYVVYTSGSTGRPKGVAVSQRAIGNTVHGVRRTYDFRVGYGCLQNLSISFDGAILDIFCTLLNGGYLVLTSQETLMDPAELVALMRRHDVKVATFIPSYLNVIGFHELPLRTLISAGEVANSVVLEQYRQAGVRCINGYGPTEAAVAALNHVIDGPVLGRSVPVGRPLDGTLAAVVDSCGAVLPAGFVGELRLGGAGLATEYVNNAPMTRERFVTMRHPLTSADVRTYRTGDLALLNADGEFEYRGRSDDQVKIRGFRIELADIESTVQMHPWVTEAAVMTIDDERTGHTGLHAFLCVDESEIAGIDGADLPPDSMHLYAAHTGKALHQLADRPVKLGADGTEIVLPVADHVDDVMALAFQRKTYRFYDGGEASVDDLHATLADALAATPGVCGDSAVTLASLAHVLAHFGRFRSAARLLPKYLYPSAGAIYAMRLYVEIANLAGVPDGFYCLDRDDLTLGWMAPPMPAAACAMDPAHACVTLHLRADPEEVGAVYGELSTALLTVEAGYMFGLLESACEAAGICCGDIANQAASVPLPGCSFGTIALGIRCNAAARRPNPTLLVQVHRDGAVMGLPGKGLYRFDDDGFAFVADEIAQTRRFAAINQSTFERSAFSIAIFDEAATTWRGHVQIGRFAQRLLMNTHGLGFCQAGFTGTRPIEHIRRLFECSPASGGAAPAFGHILLGGAISLEQRLARDGREDAAHQKGPLDLVEDFVRNRLPAYMVPQSFNVLKSMPVTPGGKTDRAALARLPRAVSTVGPVTPPRTACERAVAAAFGAIIGIADVGLESDFFRLGGDSIKAMRLSSVLGDEGLAVSVPDIFRLRTVQAIAAIAGSAPASNARHEGDDSDDGDAFDLAQTLSRIARVEPLRADALSRVIDHVAQVGHDASQIEDVTALTGMQLGIMLEDRYARENGARPPYICQMVVELDESVDVDCLSACWSDTVAHFAALRSCFIAADKVGAPLQVFLREARPRVDIHAADVTPDASVDSIARRIVEARREVGFDLASPSLAQLSIVRADHCAIVALTGHHIALDGWSSMNVLRHLFALYDARRAGIEPSAEMRESVPFNRFVRAHVSSETRQDSASFWNTYLAGWEETTALPMARMCSGAVRPKTDFSIVDDWLPAEVTASLHRFSAATDVTAAVVLQYAWAALLALHQRAGEVVFGAVRSGRIALASLGNPQQAVGMFVATAPVRVPMAGAMRIDDGLRGLAAAEQEKLPHEQCGTGQIKAAAHIDGDRDLFHTLFVFENYETGSAQAPGQGQRFRIRQDLTEESTGYPLSIMAIPGDRLQLRLHFDCHHYDAQVAGELLRRYRGLISQIVSGTVRRVDDLRLSPALSLLRGAAAPRPLAGRQTLHDHFDAAVKRSPDAIAIVDGEHTVTYAGLQALGQHLAEILAARGVRRGDIVGLYLDRGVAMVASMLATMRLGATYAPLDVDAPAARVRGVIARSRPALLLTDADRLAMLQATAADVDVMAVDPRSLALAQPEAVPQSPDPAAECAPAIDGTAAAYVIHTSGSTGEPKGVVVSHAAALNTVLAQIDAFQVAAGDSCLHNFAACFDGAVSEIFTALLAGGRLVIASRAQQRDPALLAALVREQRVAIASLLPSMIGAIDRYGIALKTLVSAGEPAVADPLRRFLARGTRCINAYGPTETAVCATMHVLEQSDPERPSVPIGVPVAGMTVRIVDERGRTVPTGCHGEIAVSGPGLALGYLASGEGAGQACAFRQLPHDDGSASDRAYFTGDIGRVLPDGTLEYLGRKDSQVKIRGYRVEPRELSAAIEASGLVGACAVSVADDQTLIAFVVPDLSADMVADLAAHMVKDTDLRAIERRLLAWIEATLPSYVWPSRICFVPNIPRLSNGKVDERGLMSQLRQRQTQAPRSTPADEARAVSDASSAGRLATIWRTLLKTDQVDMTSDFLRLGGNSLKAMLMAGAIVDEFGVELRVDTILRHPRFEDVLAAIDDHDARDSQGRVVRFGGSGASAPTLVCVPGVGALADSFGPLAEALGPMASVVALDPAPADTTDAAADVDRIVERNLQDLRNAGIGGPIVLLGHSFGGTIAYEMARRLSASTVDTQLHAQANVRVDVILIDCKPWTQVLGADAARAISRQLRAGRVASGASLLRDHLEPLVHRIDPNRRRLLAEVMERLNDGDPIDGPLLRHFDIVLGQLAMAYDPAACADARRPESVTVHLVAASASAMPDIASAWESAGAQIGRSACVTGDHFSILETPHAEGLASAIARLLNLGAGK